MRSRRRIFEALLAALLLSSASSAQAADKRTLPDYDGRGGPRTTPGQKALWAPRLLLSPLYFVSEFVVRRPLGFLITAAEKAELPSALYDFFAFGPDHKAGIVPIAFLDFGFEPSVGLYGFWDDAGFEGHDLRVRGSTWGRHWISGTVTERFRVSQRFEVTLSGTATRRPDYAFYGLGPDTRENQLKRYASDSVHVSADSRLAFAKSCSLETGVGYKGASFGHTEYDAADRYHGQYEASVDEAVADGRLTFPPGFQEGYRAFVARSRLILDSRGETGSATGLRLELSGDQGLDPRRGDRAGWLRYGSTLGGFLDLGNRGRVVSLSLTTLFADPTGDHAVPFTELVTLGGPNLMPGFRPGRLYDRSAMVATLRYAWPVWVWLNGSLQVAAGNVFGEHFEGLRAERARLSTAIGIESAGSRDSIFQALIGFGSETFESGGRIDSLRIVVGARNGF